MKYCNTINILILIVVCVLSNGCRVEEKNKTLPLLTTKEYKSTKHDFVSKKVYRGDKLVYAEMLINGKETRLYCIDGKPVVGECDEDGDGFRERLTLMAGSPEEHEVFIRSKNGDVQPMKSPELQVLREKIKTADNTLREIMSKSPNPKSN